MAKITEGKMLGCTRIDKLIKIIEIERTAKKVLLLKALGNLCQRVCNPYPREKGIQNFSNFII